MWMLWGPELTFFCNDAYRPTLGIKESWALGARSDRVWEEIWPEIGPRIEQVLTASEATWDEALMLFLERRGFQEETYHTFSYSPLADDDGAIAGMLCVVTEETERVIGERRLRVLRDLGLRMANARTSAEVWAAAEACFAIEARDTPFTLAYLFAAAGGSAELMSASGIEKGHVAAPPWIAPSDPATWPVADMLTRMEADRLEDLEARFADLPHGPWHRAPMRALLMPIAAQGQAQPIGVFIVALNPFRPLDPDYRGFISLIVGQLAAALASANAYESERRRAEALAEIDRAKTAFFTNISHEFRTPLTLMLGPLEEALTDRARLPASQSQKIDVAYRNALRLLRLVNALLDFSRVEAGRVQVRYEPVDLAGITAELVSNFRSLCDQAGLWLKVECPPLPTTVHLDREMWEKIVLNLVSNAFKFTFAGGISVSLRQSDDGASALLTVRDTGTGIPHAELPRLFERFHRIVGAQGRSLEGSGIGLALVRDLVHLHGGDVQVRSELGYGSTFTVTIPFGVGHLPVDRIAPESTVTASARTQVYINEARRWLSDAPDLETIFSKDFPGETEPLADRGQGHVLLAEDNADMREYIDRLLADQGYVVVAAADGQAALEAARSRRPDLVLSDIMMPRLDGFGLLRGLREDPSMSDVPVILLSARAGEEARVEGLAAGADDYLIKPFSARELLARVGANLSLARVRRESAEAVRARSEELEAVLATVPAAVWFTHDTDARRIWGNQGASTLLRVPEGANASLSAPEGERPPFRVFRRSQEIIAGELPIQRAARGEEVPDDELDIYFPDGSFITVLCRATPLRDDMGRAVGAVCAAVDITERKAAEAILRQVNERLEARVAERTSDLMAANKRLREEAADRERAEEQLRQAQKMEAVGQLTGGLAHDFNNLLTGITGSLELIGVRIAQGRAGELNRYITAAQGAASRAASLTHRLLAFSRRQTLDPKSVDVNSLIIGMDELLRRTVGPEIHVETVLAAELWNTLCDPNQLENAILNLCINARDAMPHGGRLTVATANTIVDENVGRALGMILGPYVAISVLDTGTGMAPDVIARAFDPFFTTKPIGMGTGLGLSMIYGFAKQSGGQVKIESEVGHGTAMRLYLPRHDGGVASEDMAAELADAPRAIAGETVLVVDDEPTVRMLVTEVLESLGYAALEASDGTSGLRILQANGRIDLLITDVGLPNGMNGRQVADAARQIRPGLKVLFITGYAENAAVGNGYLEPGMHVMIKPFAMEALATRIRAIIASR